MSRPSGGEAVRLADGLGVDAEDQTGIEVAEPPVSRLHLHAGRDERRGAGTA
jgi:hypothetical protein